MFASYLIPKESTKRRELRTQFIETFYVSSPSRVVLSCDVVVVCIHSFMRLPL